MKWSVRWAAVAVLVALLGPGAGVVSSHPLPSGAHASAVTMVSTQFTLVDEATAFRSILSSAPISVNFLPGDSGTLATQLQSQEQSHNVSISVFAGLHGDFAPFASQGYLQDLTPLLKQLRNRGFPGNVTRLSQIGTKKKHFYVPWMTATYVLAINKKALKYLPKGVNVNALTYDQLIAWGKNIQKAVGRKLIGLPAGPTGLIHRFIQGYLYPSFTRSAGVVQFKSAAAVVMWEKMRDLWAVTSSDSTSYNFMQDPLLSGDVWIAWDHVARLINAATQQPNQFILVPAPSGPKGLGYLNVIGGLAIPKGAPDVKAAEKIIDFLTKPYAQIGVLTHLAFFPVTNARIPSSLPAGIRLEAAAVSKQAHAKHTIPTLLPVGLGTRSSAFNNVYLDTFHRIVLNHESIRKVLADEAFQLQAIVNATSASCWAPDPPSKGPCRVK